MSDGVADEAGWPLHLRRYAEQLPTIGWSIHPEGPHRIGPSRAMSWDESREESGGCEHDRDQDVRAQIQRAHVGDEAGQNPAQCRGREATDENADDGHATALSQYQPSDILSCCTQSCPNSKLFGSFGDLICRDTVCADNSEHEHQERK